VSDAVTDDRVVAAFAARDAAAEEGPLPLRRPLPPAPRFPLEALRGGVLRDAVEAIHMNTQAPLAICANAVLAAFSLAAQAHADVVLPTGSAKPLTLFCITVAASGERKSSVDELALAPVRRHEDELRAAYEVALRSHRDDADAHAAAKDRLVKDKELRKDRTKLREALHGLGPAPEPPLAPLVLADNPTVEGLEKLFVLGQPSIGLFTAEGGKLIGGHLLNDDNRMKAGATLNLLWDGAPVPRIRAGEGATKLPGRRMALHAMVQPGTAETMLGDPMLADLGTLARFLVACPETAIGTRLWRETPADVAVALSRYREALLALLRKKPATGDRTNELRPARLRLLPGARAMWVAFHDEVERELNGGLAPVRAFGAKLAEHAARIAGVLCLAEDPDAAEVADAALEAGIAVARYYAAEALRLAGAGMTHPDLALAERLLAWLHGRPDTRLHMVKVYQHGPYAIRDRATAQRIVGILERHRWLRRLPENTVVDGSPRRDAWEVVRP